MLKTLYLPNSFFISIFLMPGHLTYQDIAFSVCPIYNEASTNGLKVVFDNLEQEWNVKTDVFGLQLDIHMYLRLTLPRPCKAGTGSLGGAHNYIYVNSLYGHTSGSYGPGSNSAVLGLVAGDTVYLDIKLHDSFLYGGGDEVYSTFSGYLLSLIDSHPRLLGNVC